MNVTAHQMKHTECMLNQVLPAGNPSLCTEESLTQAVAGCVKTIREALQRTPGLACVDVRRLPEAERRAIARLRRKWERCLGEYEERVNARTLWSASRRLNDLKDLAAHVLLEIRACGRAAPKNAAFVGSGPFPSSAISLSCLCKGRVTCIDCDDLALARSRELLGRLNLEHRFRLVQARGDQTGYCQFSHVLVAAQVSNKRALLKRLARGSPKNVRVALRYGNGVQRLLWPGIEAIPPREWRILDVLMASNRAYETVILARRGRGEARPEPQGAVKTRVLSRRNVGAAREFCLNLVNRQHGFNSAAMRRFSITTLPFLTDFAAGRRSGRAPMLEVVFVATMREEIVGVARVRAERWPVADVAAGGRGEGTAGVFNCFLMDGKRLGDAGSAVLSRIRAHGGRHGWCSLVACLEDGGALPDADFWATQGFRRGRGGTVYADLLPWKG